jgi:hypothetical protein
MVKFVTIFFSCLALVFNLKGEAPRYDFIAGDDQALILKRQFSDLRTISPDSTRLILNDSILAGLKRLLAENIISQHFFDSIPGLAVIASDDQQLTFYHWNIQHSDGHHQYYGFLKIRSSVKDEIYELKDHKSQLPEIDTVTLSPSNWFGALYYKIIRCETSGGEPFYTLLGWSGENNFITRKVIEIVQTDKNNRPSFGKAVFDKYNKRDRKRIIFSYSANVTMVLRFENQVVSTRKTWNKRKRVFDVEESRSEVIVADQLTPMDPLMEGQFQYYIPAGDIQNGFVLHSGRWEFIESLEPRNIK